jgi:hypothetical protein
MVRNELHSIALNRLDTDGKMCVVPVRLNGEPVQHRPLTRLRLDGILLCEAHGRYRDRTTIALLVLGEQR